MTAAPQVSLPRFEGPLDLLLSLVRKNQIDLADIPIAEITRQYLAYMHEAGHWNLDLGSEFVYMASVLIQIKSKCLLPVDPEIATTQPDPRQELARQLLDYEQARQAAEFLKQKLEVTQASWSRSAPPEEFRPPADYDFPEGNSALNLLQVLRVAQQALAAARTYELVRPADSVDMAEMMRWLDERVAANSSGLDAWPLFAEQPDAPHRNALFLAMLEMVKAERIWVKQEGCFEAILLSPRPVPCGTSVP